MVCSHLMNDVLWYCGPRMRHSRNEFSYNREHLTRKGGSGLKPYLASERVARLLPVITAVLMYHLHPSACTSPSGLHSFWYE